MTSMWTYWNWTEMVGMKRCPLSISQEKSALLKIWPQFLGLPLFPCLLRSEFNIRDRALWIRHLYQTPSIKQAQSLTSASELSVLKSDLMQGNHYWHCSWHVPWETQLLTSPRSQLRTGADLFNGCNCFNHMKPTCITVHSYLIHNANTVNSNSWQNDWSV